jgi:hypothetical protein
MNGAISDSVLLELRKQVERAVRPVRAGKKWKLTMREELLAHLSAIYQEEHQRAADEQAAVAAALERFGQPSELTSELNRSLGFEERLSRRLDFWAGTRKDESLWHLALRCGLFPALTILFMVTVVGVASLFGTRDDDPTKYSFLFKLFVGTALLLWTFMLGIHTTLRALRGAPSRPRWAAGIGVSLAWTVVIVALSDGLWWTLTWSVESTLDRLPVSLCCGFATLPVIFLMVAWLGLKDDEQLRAHWEWQSLELEG